MHPPEWVQRCVETYTLEDLTSARRRLTMDLVLPTDTSAFVRRNGMTAKYHVPLLRISKTEPLRFVDLRDEQGAAIPMPTVGANAVMTLDAIEHAIRLGAGLGDAPLPPGLHDALVMLVYLERPRSDVGAAFATEVLDRMAIAPEARARIEQVLTHLVLNSMVWVTVTCEPGEQRVIKLAALIELGRPRLLARKEEVKELDFHGLRVRAPGDGPIDVKGSLQSLRAWVASHIAWDSVDITIRDPAVQDASSYHLQITPERDLDIERIEFVPDRETHTTAGIEPVVRQGHVFVRDPALRLQRAVPVSLSIRASRQGFLNVSVVATALIAGLLWWYRAEVGDVDGNDNNATIAAAVLLLVPTLPLLGMRGESDLAASLLVGIRVAAGVSMLVAGLAAAAIAGIRPASLPDSLAIYATVATFCCAVIVVAWLGTFGPLRRVANAARCSWCGRGDRRRWSWRVTTLLLIATGFLAAHLDATDTVVDDPELSVAGVGTLSLVTLVAGWWPQSSRVPIGVRLLTLAGALAGALWCLAVLWPDTFGGEDTMRIAEIGLLGLSAWAILTGIAVMLAPVLPRAPAEEGE